MTDQVTIEVAERRESVIVHVDETGNEDAVTVNVMERPEMVNVEVRLEAASGGLSEIPKTPDILSAIAALDANIN